MEFNERVEFLKQAEKEFYIKVNQLKEKYSLLYEFDKYGELYIDYKKYEHNAKLCFKHSTGVSSDFLDECGAIFDNLFPYPYGMPRSEIFPC